MTFWKPEYENIGGFGDPTARYPLGENMTGFQSKQAVAQAKVNEDDDIQDYVRPWVGLTDEEIWSTVSRIGTSDSDVNPYAKLADARAIEQALKEKNT